MFNKKLKEEAIKTLQKAANEYNKQLEDTMCKMEELQEIRDSSVKIINDVNYYKSDLKNSPKEYDTTIAQATSRCDHFNERINKMLKNESQGIGGTAGTDALEGGDDAAITPSMAIAVAMALGTSSTSKAVNSLSGAVAINTSLTSLASLSGVTLAGGTGIASGPLLLTAANPVFLAIGALAFLGGGLWASRKNKKIAKAAEESTKAIKKETERIKEIGVTVDIRKAETHDLNVKITGLYNAFQERKMFNYNLFNEEDKDLLRVLINSTETLSKKIEETVTNIPENKIALARVSRLF